MKKKISELELYEIDYLVAKAENLKHILKDKNKKQCLTRNSYYDFWHEYSPTTNPSQAWHIIEREGITITPYIIDDGVVKSWRSHINIVDGYCIGKTSLEAAMRCYCASIYDEEVEI